MAEPGASSSSGFTLLEVLVAFIITALALGALFNGAAASLTQTAVVGRYEEALSRAQSHLAEASHGSPSSTQAQEGEEGHGFHWAVHIERIANAPPRPPDPAGNTQPVTLALYSVQVTESWEDRDGTRQVQLTGRRIGMAPP